MVRDNEAINKVVPAIIELVQDEQKQLELKTNIGKYAVVNADEHIAGEILNDINN